MKIVYIEDENGEVFSEDKKRRFTRLVGTEAYEYLKSAEGKNKVFFKTGTEEESGDLVLVEAPDNQKASVRSFLNHEPELFTPVPDNRLNTEKTQIKKKNGLSPKR